MYDSSLNIRFTLLTRKLKLTILYLTNREHHKVYVVHLNHDVCLIFTK